MVEIKLEREMEEKLGIGKPCPFSNKRISLYCITDQNPQTIAFEESITEVSADIRFVLALNTGVEDPLMLISEGLFCKFAICQSHSGWGRTEGWTTDGVTGFWNTKITLV